MSGLYFHIPFCRKACVYCDFHFSTSLATKDWVLAAMRTELRTRIAELKGAALGSIYFGGGTPSLLSPKELSTFLDETRSLARIEADAEITIEANPDDISAAVLAGWRGVGITRVSLGIQSFREERLQWMGRAHNAEQSLRAIEQVANAGFSSWTIDLIYGLPGMDLTEWDEQLTIALEHGMPHLSAYCLTVETRTALHKQVLTGRIVPSNDEDQAAQFEHGIARVAEVGLVQYEISNFGKRGHFAKHNTSYWQGIPYLGIGPSAHSYDGVERRWNVANNVRYALGVEGSGLFWEKESLTPAQRINERLLTGLRTMWGVDIASLGEAFRKVNAKTIQHYLALNELEERNGHLILTPKGKNFADRIASDLFMPTT
ncbi:MAG: radical SAM family heme chaperone HemW [Flavobacteriales bacterium]|nr:radical SAM family heme chaperone HemW [Flavobacteriales bacterium]